MVLLVALSLPSLAIGYRPLESDSSSGRVETSQGPEAVLVLGGRRTVLHGQPFARPPAAPEPQPATLRARLAALHPPGPRWLFGQRMPLARRYATPEAGLIAHLPQGPPRAARRLLVR